ncbi:OVCH1 protein, partial [Nycticryphes semicollaris]|nr:OVCH1 protein [Nycticryphes semicollaris]
QVRQVKTIVMHPDFDMLSYESSIALMQLDVPLEYNAAMRPVCLPNRTETLSSSSLCTASGWRIIKKVPVLEKKIRKICERNYYFSYPGGITARMLSTGFASEGGQNS